MRVASNSNQSRGGPRVADLRMPNILICRIRRGSELLVMNTTAVAFGRSPQVGPTTDHPLASLDSASAIALSRSAAACWYRIAALGVEWPSLPMSSASVAPV